MSSVLEVSVIIPVWNDCKRIVQCINALKNQSLARHRFEIIVVDNGSTDNTFEVLSKIDGISLLQELKPGSYAARNKAIDIAKGTYLAFTDSDCLPDKKWLEELIACAQSDDKIGIVAGDIAFFQDPEDNVEKEALAFESLFSMNQKKYASEGLCITANWLSTRELLCKLNGFNPELKSGGDHEMAKRIVSQDYKVIFSQEGVVAHPARNKKEILKKRRRVIGGHWDSKAPRMKFIKMFWGFLKLLIKRLLILIVSKKMGLKLKIGVAFLLFEIFFVSVQELCFLRSGRISARS